MDRIESSWVESVNQRRRPGDPTLTPGPGEAAGVISRQALGPYSIVSRETDPLFGTSSAKLGSKDGSMAG